LTRTAEKRWPKASSPATGELIRLAYDAQLEGRFDSRDALLDWLKTQI
jgi:hypothetical protein